MAAGPGHATATAGAAGSQGLTASAVVDAKPALAGKAKRQVELTPLSTAGVGLEGDGVVEMWQPMQLPATHSKPEK